MARKMCVEHWGPEKKPFRNVPWDWNIKTDNALIAAAQDEIDKYLQEHNIEYSVRESFPGQYVFY